MAFVGDIIFTDQNLRFLLVFIQQYNMNLKARKLEQFFSTVKSSSYQDLGSDDIQITSYCSEKSSKQRLYKISKTNNFLTISRINNGILQNKHHLDLLDSIRFQRIYRNLYHKKQLSGFRLINQKDQFVDVIIEFEDLTKIWIKELSRSINQWDFHRVYQTIKKIGKGTTSTIYEVRRIQDGQFFAAKVFLKATINEKQDKRKSMNQEIQFLRAIQHDNIIKLFGVFQSENAVYLVLQRLTGGNLLERINKQRGLSNAETKQIIKGIMKGLAYLHKFDIVHRDIKLENIMFRDQASLHPIILDFGLATIVDDEPYIYYRCGTPGYVAPEIIRAKQHKKVTTACDIFSVGVIFHIFLTNRYLFEGNNISQICKQNMKGHFNLNDKFYSPVDPCAISLLMNMLMLKPSKRLTAQQVLEHQFLQFPQPNSLKLLSPASTETGQKLII